MSSIRRPLAPYACEACRRLKRRCSKDLPACSLCDRLQKTCDYTEPTHPRQPSSLVNARQVSLTRLSESTSSQSTRQESHTAFPAAFFLDQDHLSPLASDALHSSGQPFGVTISLYLEPDRLALCERYLASIHTWLPIISRKRMLYELNDNRRDGNSSRHLLLLCMQLCCTSADIRPMESDLYSAAKSLCFSAESMGVVCLELVQSLVLLAVFELSHAIYPAAYLTIGRAAQLGLLMGLHSKHTKALFKLPETWTLREEQRRTWWAVFILERVIQLEPCSLPLIAPEPQEDELLPVDDDEWNAGNIVPSEALFTTSFSSAANVGHFARLCQSAHMLGKVMKHKNTKKLAYNTTAVVQEAEGLHNILCALKAAILESRSANYTSTTFMPASQAALALCNCARYLLYAMYGCNENHEMTSRERNALETEMQILSLDGIKAMALREVPEMLLFSLECPLLAHCMYLTATECAWFWREDHTPEMRNALSQVVQALQYIGKQWTVGIEFLALLERDGILQCLDSGSNSSYELSMSP